MLLRSYRVAILRQCFSLLKTRSIRLRSRYSSRSYSQWSPRLDLGGMTARVPYARINASILLLSYPLSAITAPVSIPVSRGMAWETSARCPPVRVKRTGRPFASHHQANLGAQSAAGAAQSLTLAPPLPQAAC